MFLRSKAGGFLSNFAAAAVSPAFTSGMVAGGGTLSLFGGSDSFLTFGGGVALPSGFAFFCGSVWAPRKATTNRLARRRDRGLIIGEGTPERWTCPTVGPSRPRAIRSSSQPQQVLSSRSHFHVRGGRPPALLRPFSQ